jgi:SAM-dependent methyltransferase
MASTIAQRLRESDRVRARMGADVLGRRWTDRWLDQNRKKLRNRAAPGYRNWATDYLEGHRQHFQTVCELVGELRAEHGVERVLDVGAVPGHISALIAGAGMDVEAIDLDPSRAERVFEKWKIPTHRADIETDPLPVADSSFDVALLCQTLEHLRIDPVHPIEEIHRVLRPGGFLITSVPQITPHMKWRFFRGDALLADPIAQREKLEKLGHVGDVRLLSRDQVEKLLDACGFEVVKVARGGGLRTRSGGTVDEAVGRAMMAVARRRMQSTLYFVARAR